MQSSGSCSSLEDSCHAVVRVILSWSITMAYSKLLTRERRLCCSRSCGTIARRVFSRSSFLIDSDSPEAAGDESVFSDDEIVFTLHDEGPEGRFVQDASLVRQSEPMPGDHENRRRSLWAGGPCRKSRLSGHEQAAV